MARLKASPESRRRRWVNCLIDSEIADCGRSLVLQQVTNGLAVRMAVLFLVNGGKGPQEVTAN